MQKTFCRKPKGHTKLNFHVCVSLPFCFRALDFSGHSRSISLNFLSPASFSLRPERQTQAETTLLISYMIDPAKKVLHKCLIALVCTRRPSTVGLAKFNFCAAANRIRAGRSPFLCIKNTRLTKRRDRVGGSKHNSQRVEQPTVYSPFDFARRSSNWHWARRASELTSPSRSFLSHARVCLLRTTCCVINDKKAADPFNVEYQIDVSAAFQSLMWFYETLWIPHLHHNFCT